MRMELTKLANGRDPKLQIGRSPSPTARGQKDAARLVSGNKLPRKGAPKKVESARPVRKKTDDKLKSNKLVCRYCGSDDLAPSFIKRRDRRCRKCFSKRYGSAAVVKKARDKK
jgi:hypothetical protein